MVDSLKKKTKIVVNVGSGGVGKTTLSSALALNYVGAGEKVLVITVDPSQRLATTLGIIQDGQVHKVNLKDTPGELWAAVLNSKLVFEEFVRKVAKYSSSAERLMNNNLFKQLTTSLSGSQEFSALEFLYSNYEKGIYDRIILDTPPTKHAMDFLEAPRKISILFTEQISKWLGENDLQENFFGRLFFNGSKKVIEILASLTGQDFIVHLKDFFASISDWREELFLRAEKMHKLMTAEGTEFNLITALDRAKLLEAEYIVQRLAAHGCSINSVIVNRCFPEWLIEPTGSGSNVDLFLVKANQFYLARESFYLVFKQKYDTLAIYSLPEYQDDIASVKDLYRLCEDLKKRVGKNENIF